MLLRRTSLRSKCRVILDRVSPAHSRPESSGRNSETPNCENQKTRGESAPAAVSSPEKGFDSPRIRPGNLGCRRFFGRKHNQSEAGEHGFTNRGVSAVISTRNGKTIDGGRPNWNGAERGQAQEWRRFARKGNISATGRTGR